MLSSVAGREVTRSQVQRWQHQADDHIEALTDKVNILQQEAEHDAAVWSMQQAVHKLLCKISVISSGEATSKEMNNWRRNVSRLENATERLKK